MTIRSPVPHFNTPPKEYDRRHFAEFVRSFSQYARAMQNPGEGRHTRLVMTNMPTDDVNVEPGMLYRHGNVVMISLASIAAVAGSAMTISAGSVTVSVS